MRRLLFVSVLLCALIGLWMVQARPRRQDSLASPAAPNHRAPKPLAAVAPTPATVRAAQPASPVATRQPALADEPIAAFAQWAARFLAAPVADRPALLPEGRALAEQRRVAFRQLITENPEQALAEAVSMVVRQHLPSEIVARLEERVAGRGVVRVYQSTPEPDQPILPTTRIAELENGKTFEAHTFGRRAEKVTWTPNASLHGVAVDGALALSPEPLRVLEVGEVPDPTLVAKAVCPVSGRGTSPPAADAPITETTPAVEAFGEIVYLCDGSHTTVYRDALIQAEGGTGGPTSFTGLLPAAPTPSLGQLRILYIPLTFQGPERGAGDGEQVLRCDAGCQ